MKKRKSIIILAFFGFLSHSIYSQSDCETNPPSAPVLTFVSLQSETGKTELNWTLSTSLDIAAYVIYSFKEPDGIPIDTIWDPAATSYVYTTTKPNNHSVSYVVTAMRLPRCTSPFSNVLSTVFTSVSIDTCNNKIIVSWNSYDSYPKDVADYSVLLSVNGGNFTEAAKVSADQNSFTFNSFTTDAEYCFRVRANLEGGTFSSSNEVCISTKMQRPPAWINADQSVVDADNKISLSFTIDPLSEINRFRLERKSGHSAKFEEIAQPLSQNGSVLFQDDKADINTVNYYRLSAINNCDSSVTFSNLSSNIVLSLERTGDDLMLRWNSCQWWLGRVSSYRLFINTGQGFEEKVALEPTDTVFTLSYQEIMYEVTGDELCFYVSASETSNPYGITGHSISSVTCSLPTENITVPNVFTPNNDLVNDLFRPVLSFTPLDYHLIISNRRGEILFETRDFSNAWDGTRNGDPVPQGVCLWFLKIKTPSGKSISKTGTIIVITTR